MLPVRPFAILTLLLSSAGCAADPSPQATGGDEQDINVASNLDVQVIRASVGPSVFLGGNPAFSQRDCKFFQLERREGNKGVAKADCTEELMAGAGRPAFSNYIEPLAWVRLRPDVLDVDQVEAFRHWCSLTKIVVAVKAAAVDSPKFLGIGFWSHENIVAGVWNYERVFYARNDPKLVRTGEATLKNGERVYLYEFVGAGPCAVNGTGDNPTHELLFKPFVTYEGGHQRWEALPDNRNHGIRHGQTWDRSSDLLR